MAAPSFASFGALALAAPSANAVGAVRLALGPSELTVELVRVAGFRQGFAPGGVTDAVRFAVPYTAVRGLVRRGRMLYLALDPAVATPHSRFALARFTADPAEALARAYRARARARWASYLGPAPLGALAAAAAPDTLASGWLGRGSLGLLAALAAWALLREIVAWRTWGGPLSDRARDAFELELSRRLGLTPPSPDGAYDRAPAEPPAEEPAAIPARAALIVALAAAAVVAGMVSLRTLAAPHEPPPPVETLHTGIAAAVERIHAVESSTGEAPAAASEPVSERPRCVCMRADSPLWKDGVPLLAVLPFTPEDQGGGPVAPHEDRRGFPRFDFDVAVVNDSADPERDVRVTLTFARRSKSGRRVGATDRGLFWAGALEPGHAVRWRVHAPGSEMRVDPSVVGTLEEAGVEAAPADAFAELTRSRYRAVRVQGALMLAYLRDRRARDAALAIDARTPEDRSVLARIARAAAPIIACDVKLAEGRLAACVFNGGEAPATGLSLREVPADDTPAAAPRSLPIEGTIPVHTGARLDFPLEGALPEEWIVAGPG